MDLPNGNGRDDAPVPNGGVGTEETAGRRKVELVREAIHGGVPEEKRMDGQGEKEMPAKMSSLLTKVTYNIRARIVTHLSVRIIASACRELVLTGLPLDLNSQMRWKEIQIRTRTEAEPPAKRWS
jgi:hypothetical protein